MIELIDSIINLIIVIVKALIDLLPFSSPYNLIRYITEQGSISGIIWIDKALFWIAGIVPLSITAFISKKVELDGRIKIIICIVLYALFLQLFASVIFWCIIAGILTIVLGLWVKNFAFN